jgi:hypothetical protein
MNSSAAYRQTTLNFGTRQEQESTQPGTPNHTLPSIGVTPPMETHTTMPQILIRSITQLAQKYAAIACKSTNLEAQVTILVQDKEQGNIPAQLQYKFKKLFNEDTDTSLRSTIIVAAIDSEISRIKGKIDELRNLFNSRYEDLESVLAGPLRESNLVFSNEQIGTTFDYFIREKKLEFILKQQRDVLKQDKKKERFLLRKESENAVAVLSVKQVTAFKQEIESLKKQLKKVKISSPKNKKGKGKPKHPKESTGTKRKGNGKNKSTARTK